MSEPLYFIDGEARQSHVFTPPLPGDTRWTEDGELLVKVEPDGVITVEDGWPDNSLLSWPDGKYAIVRIDDE